MQQLISQIEEYKKEMAAAQAADAKEAEAFRIKYLGTKGVVKAIMGEMRNVAADQRKEAGQLLNEFKQYAEARFEELKAGVSVMQNKLQPSIFLFPAISFLWAAVIRSR